MTAPLTLTPAAPQRSPRAHRWLAPTRRAATAVAMGAALCLAGASAWAAGTMRVAMTLSDIPVPNGQTDQGAEGMRFILNPAVLPPDFLANPAPARLCANPAHSPNG